MKDPPLDDASLRPKKSERTEEDLTPKSEHAQAEVKEEQEEEEPNEELPTVQIRAPDWLNSTIWLEHDPNARPNEDPLAQVRNETWTARANLKTLRTRLREVEGLHDARDFVKDKRHYLPGSAKLKNASLHHFREYMHRIILIESRVGNSGGVIGETLRQCQVRLDQYAAGLTDLRERMRTQDRYHDLSEQESDDEIQQMIGRADTEHDNDAEIRPANRSRRRYRHCATASYS